MEDISNWNISSITSEHWLKFFENGTLPAEDWVYVLMASYMLCIAPIAFMGNMICIYVFTCTAMRSPSNLLMANLAVCDILTVTCAFPMMIHSALHKQWLFGETGCIWFGFTSAQFAFASIGTMVCVGLDRVFSITRHGTWSLSYKSSLIMIAVVWLYATLFVVPPIFGWSRYFLEGLQISCTFDYIARTRESVAFNMCAFVLGFAVPLAIIAGSYSTIIRHLLCHTQLMLDSRVTFRKSSSKGRNRRSSSIPSSTDSSHIGAVHQRAIWSSLITIFIFNLAWTPYAVMYLVGLFGDQQLLTPTATTLPLLFAKTAVIANPVGYFFTSGNFRKVICGYNTIAIPNRNLEIQARQTRRRSSPAFPLDSRVTLEEEQGYPGRVA